MMAGGRRTVLVLLAGLMLGACAGRLQPAPTATMMPGPGESATAAVADVRVVASARAWDGFPRGLPLHLIPVLLTIDNGRPEPVTVRYEDIALVAPEGRRFAALAPQAIHGSVTEPVASGPYAWGPPYAYRPLAFYDPWWSPWWYYDPGPTYVRVPLPTSDMLRLALPEPATIEPGHLVQGFVYFERDVDKGTPLDLEVRVADAKTGQPVGVIRIPFRFE